MNKVYIELVDSTEEIVRVSLVHNFPDELEDTTKGMMLELPPQNAPEEHVAELMYNKSSDQLFWTYKLTPKDMAKELVDLKAEDTINKQTVDALTLEILQLKGMV